MDLGSWYPARGSAAPLRAVVTVSPESGLGHVLHAGDQIANLARSQLVDRLRLRPPNPDLVGIPIGAGLHEPDLGPRPQPPVHHPHRADHAPVLVEVGVEDQRLERAVGVADRGRSASHHGIEQLPHAFAGLGADMQQIGGRDAQHLLDLLRPALGLGRGQIDLVQGGHHLQLVLHGQVAVGQRLGFDALGRVHQQDHRLAGSQGAAHLVAEVHVAGGVDEVDHEALIIEANALELDGDAPLPLQVHGVQILGAHLPGVDRPANLQHAVGQRGLAVVDVGDDRGIADSREVYGHDNLKRYRPFHRVPMWLAGWWGGRVAILWQT